MTAKKTKEKSSVTQYALMVNGEKCLRNSILSKACGRTDLLGPTIKKYPEFVKDVHYVETTFNELREQNSPAKVGTGNSTMTIKLATYQGVKKLIELWGEKYYDDLIKVIKKYYKKDMDLDPYFSAKDIDINSEEFADIYKKFKSGELLSLEVCRLLGITRGRFKKLITEYENMIQEEPEHVETNNDITGQVQQETPAQVTPQEIKVNLTDKIAHEDMTKLIEELHGINKNMETMRLFVDRQNELMKFLISIITSKTNPSPDEINRMVVLNDSDIDPNHTQAFAIYRQNMTNIVSSILDNPKSKYKTTNSVLNAAYSKIEKEFDIDWNEYTRKYVDRLHKQPKNMMTLIYWIERYCGRQGMLSTVLTKMNNELDK